MKHKKVFKIHFDPDYVQWPYDLDSVSTLEQNGDPG